MMMVVSLGIFHFLDPEPFLFFIIFFWLVTKNFINNEEKQYKGGANQKIGQ